MKFNQIHIIEEYYYIGGDIDYIEKMITIDLLNFLYLALKLGLLIWLCFFIYNKTNK